MGGTVDRGIWVTTYQGQSNLTSTRGSHTWRGGVDVQWAQRTAQDGAGNMGTFNYDNTYTRAADTTNVFPAQQHRLEPGRVHAGHADLGVDRRRERLRRPQQLLRDVRAGHVARRRRNLTVNLGLRFEYENGIKESAEPGAALVRSGRRRCRLRPRAEAAYAANPIPELPASQFNVQGGSVYAGAAGI